MSAFHYSLYGMGVRSNRAIAGLQSAPSTAHEVAIDFRGDVAAPPATQPFFRGDFETLWHLDDDRWLIRYTSDEKGYVWSAAFARDAITLGWNDDAILDDIAPILQGSAISATLHLRGVHLLHACVIAIDDDAIAIMGTPGAGKSTTAAAFVGAGHPLVSDDIAALDFDGDAIRVHSGYPRMRLYADSARAAGFAATALHRVFHEPLLGDKQFIELPPSAFRRGPLPLRAIYMLGPRAKAMTITALDARAALPVLMANVYAHRFLDRRRLQTAFAHCARIASTVPVRVIRAADDLDALPALVRAML